MDIGEIATRFAGEMITHQGKPAGKAGDAQAAQGALERAAKAIMEQHDTQRKAAKTLLSQWDSEASSGFQSRSAKFGDELTTTAEAGLRGAKIVSEVTEALSARHTTGGNLVDEFVTKATGLLKGGFAVAGIAMPGALLKAVGEVADLAGEYIKESGGNLKDARAERERAPGGAAGQGRVR
jgi:hypothetical protein